ncbi:MAG: diaminopimelate dehydrogenase [Methanomassiliicoccaceae archaeon]|nr:diaminopimelate dehydrogenase [Methanomassiliicoccaceae archaeon]
MARRIRIGIYGYGNVARGAERAIAKSSDMRLEAVFTRRSPDTIRTLTPGVTVAAAENVTEYKDKIDVMLLCGGSATDLPEQGPELAKHFNIVDTYDTHAKIPEYLEAVNAQSVSNKKAAVISVGWDPGVFSLMKAMLSSMLPDGKNYAFWGPGVSQGHSDAIRRIDGVTGAVQYTVPSDDVMNEVRNGSLKDYTVRQKHKRICYVSVKEGADKDRIADSVKRMPYYFSDYDTEVIFVPGDELEKEHSGMPHAGSVLRNGITGSDEKYTTEFSIKFDSNPGFTGSVMAAFARAAFRFHAEGNFGAKTILDIPVSYISEKSRDQLIKETL